MDGIFISYRRDDSAGYAGRLYDRLVPHFGAERVFMDVEGIELGADFVTAIEEAVGSCRVLVVIIGDEWLTTADRAGHRRIDDPHDFIRLETVTALTRGIRVVPVLVGGALMPRGEDLPDDLKPLARRQAIEISHKQWEATTNELIHALEDMLAPGAAPGESAARVTTARSKPAPLAATVADEEQGRHPTWRMAAVASAALFVLGGVWWAWTGGQGGGSDGEAAKSPSDTLLTAGAKTDAGKPAAAAPATAPVAAAPPVVVAAAPAPKPPETVVAAAAPPPAAVAPTPAAVTTRPATMAARVPPVRVPPVEPRTPAPANPPVAAPAPAPAPVARVEPQRSPVEPRAADTGTAPRVGESWTYRTRGKWPTSPQRSIVIAVQSVVNDVVTEGLRGEGMADDVRRSAGARPMFMNWSHIGTEFSPYLGAYNDLAHLGTLRGFSTPDMPPNWAQWYSEAKVVGQETISVPAGSFQAHKVEVWSSRQATGGPTMAGIEPVRVHYLIWYAPPLKRYVKMQRRVLMASGMEGERDVFELVARR